MISKARRKLNFWMQVLDLDGYKLRVIRVDPNQVMDAETGKIGINLVAVGLILDGDSPTIEIHTTRRLRDRDTAHELTHVRYPELSHGEVEEMTESLIVTRDLNYMGTVGFRERWVLTSR